MTLLTSYLSQESFFHRLDPRTKLIWLTTGVVACLLLDQIAVSLALIAMVLGSSVVAKLDLRSLLPITRIFSVLAVGMILIQLLFHSDSGPLLWLGPVALHREGFPLAVQGTLRLYCVVLFSFQFTMWTHPADLSQALVKTGVPYRYAMLAGLALRFFPIVEKELGDILDAQGGRGMELGSPLRKGLALAPITVSLCLRTLRRANEVALAMELRGYGFRRHRSYLHTIAYRPADYAMTATLAVSLALCLGVHFFGSANPLPSLGLLQ